MPFLGRSVVKQSPSTTLSTIVLLCKKNVGISLHLVLNTEELEDFLHLPLSPLAATQLLQVAEDILTLPATVEKDTWNYIWGSPIYSTSRAYKQLTGSMPTHPFF